MPILVDYMLKLPYNMFITVYISCWKCCVHCRINIGWIWGKNSKSALQPRRNLP